MVNCVIIDDNQDIVNMFSDLLEISGIKVIATGTDGMKAVELYEKYSPDVIFVDLVMPRYDGFYAIKNIRKIDPNSKIIVVTGDLTMDESNLLDVHKVTAVIYKPFDIHKVKQCITDVFLD
ncbi:MAG: response regulator [Nitrosarchaeum sp.]|nr:response regulator [Nitrosarchaeum sp.]